MIFYVDQNSQNAKNFYKAVSNFSKTAKAWDSMIRYEIKPDERYDPTLISRRVYGSSDEFLAVMACAGTSSFEDEIVQKTIVLPNRQLLERIKRKTGFESIPDNRYNGKARWDR